MSIRCISEVPSKIVKIVDERAVSAGQRTVDPRGISTDPAPDFLIGFQNLVRVVDLQRYT
jgi:hypothetical protein